MSGRSPRGPSWSYPEGMFPALKGSSGAAHETDLVKRLKMHLLEIGALGLFLSPCPLSASPAQGASSTPLHTFTEMQQLIVSLSNRIKPAVVHVDVTARRGEERRRSMGSGLIISADGTIVTNQHVIDHAEKIQVVLDDKSKYDATVLRQDRQTDLALLKITASRPLPFAKLADSDKVEVGQWVIAVGNPFGFDRTVSFGIVSGKGRYIPDSENGVRLVNDFLQTDALIDPGNSGGPLVNLEGEVIGINSAGMGRGQGFTIPSKVVQEVLTRHEVEGRIERGWVGIYPQAVSRELANFMGRPTLQGVLIADVSPGSPAEKAGLRSGDVLTRINGQTLDVEQEQEIPRFAQIVTHLSPGAQVATEYVRDGQRHSAEMQVGLQPLLEGKEMESNFGAVFREITLNQVIEYRLERAHGVYVSEIHSGTAADEAGLERGDVIIAVDGHPVESIEQLSAAIDTPKPHPRFLLQLLKGKLKCYAFVDRSSKSKARKTDEETSGATP
jgi:S1-C subfamily serine protease